ncbi:MAG: hypothetical protein ACJAVW_003550, partial [Spirosomataceae bacterium]
KTGLKTDKNEVDEKRIQRHSIVPELTYRIVA